MVEQRNVTPRTGVAAGVPYVALPPSTDGPAPLVVTWHLMDSPRTPAAMAAALPLDAVPAWRVYLGLPFSGDRMPDGGVEVVFARAREDTLLRFLGPVIEQAAAEFPAALAALREQLPTDGTPVTVVGGSAGGGAALLVLADRNVEVRAGVVINAGITARSLVAVTEELFDLTYTWSDASRAVAERLDFVARAGDIAARTPQPPLLIVSGAEDHAGFQADAKALDAALRARYAQPSDVTYVSVPGLAHPLADEPGLEAAPQTALARTVEGIVSGWLRERL
jgi:dienelactone hydrolase